MRKAFCICGILLLASMSLKAQPGQHTPNNPHSNGPGVKDRDFGKDRAADAGKGKKEGLEGDQGKKKGHTKKHHGKAEGQEKKQGA